MALPTLTKTWQFNVNQLIAYTGNLLDTNRLFHLTYKNTLTGFASSPWAMRYSCNSVTAGTPGDGVDRLTTAANFVFGNIGAAHSWYVLRQTGTGSNTELLVSLESASSNGQSAFIAMSPNAGFTGGSTTLKPTATDSVTMYSGTGWLINGTPTYRLHAQLSTDGQCTRIFNYDGGTTRNVLIIDKPYLPTAGWSNPVVGFAAVGSALLASYMCSPLGNLSANINGTPSLIMATSEGVASQLLSANTACLLANEISGEWPMFPAGIASITTGTRGRHGTFQDLWFGSNNVNSGDTYPNSPSNEFAQFSNLILPWNGSAVALS